LQPTSANAARTGIANSGIIDFISLFFVFVVHIYYRRRDGKSVPAAIKFMEVMA
jgi:hypothetical protein